MSNQTTAFLDVKSFITEEVDSNPSVEPAQPVSSYFVSLYESVEDGSMVNPETEEYVTLLNTLYDEEFDEALATLVNEAMAIYETQFPYQLEDPQTVGYQAERLLTQHFAPLVAEAETMFEALAREFSQRDPNTLTEAEIETMFDRYQPSADLSPNFEEFWGKLKKLAKKVVKVAAKFSPIALVLKKIKPLIKPLLKRVIQTAIGKLPPYLQPIATKLAGRLSFLKEFELTDGADSSVIGIGGVTEIQLEFDRQIANLVFARDEVEQDTEIARVLTEQTVPDTYPLAELDRARDQFIQSIGQLKDGEDVTPYVENFLPAILPALRMGIKLIGRKKVVNFLAKFLAKLIVKFVGPKYTPMLSQAIVDAGLRLMQLEATGEIDPSTASTAVAATLEDTVRRISELPDYVLDNQELLEGFALEAFEQAAATNLPPVLSEQTYRQHPNLKEARKLRGMWIMLPHGRRKRYKKFSRRIATRLAPHKVSELETFEGIPLEGFLEEQLGMAPGEDVEAFVHLYEAIPGTQLADIARHEESISNTGAPNGDGQLHPLTRDAATLLLGEPELGQDEEPSDIGNPYASAVGQRFYYLEIPNKRPLTVPGPNGKISRRRPTRTRLILDFPKNEIRVNLFLSEIRAQEIAVKLRQNAHNGAVTAHLQRLIKRGLRSAFKGRFGRLKIVHEAVTPDEWVSALQRLPVMVQKILIGRLTEWVLKGVADYLKQNSAEFIKAAEDAADGVTLVISLGNPPGFPQLRQALKGKKLSLASLKLPDGVPVVKIKTSPGYTHE